MNFDFSPEQVLLKDSVERLLARHYGFEQRKHYHKEPAGWSAALWAHYAELGLLGLPFSEIDGGFGGSTVETMIVMEAFGRALVLEPYLVSIVLCGALMRHGASAAQRATLVPAIAEGSLTLAFAHAEPQARHDLAHVRTSATQAGDGFVINGSKSLVLHGGGANKLIVSARLGGAPRDRSGLSLFLLDADAPGIARRAYMTQDGTRAAEITFLDVAVRAADQLGESGAALRAIEHAVDETVAMLCAEAVGCMEEALKLTVEYLKTRSQFGVPIGSFQVLQHRASEMFIHLEQARSMALYAVMSAAEPDARERRRAMSAAKVQIGRSARFIGQQAVQLHGGNGMSMEYKIGHLFKRLTVIDKLFGDADYHLDLLAGSGSSPPAA